jgi:putative ABC transport system substrate-binding protein
MKRRQFVWALAGGLLCLPHTATAQQDGNVRRIGFLYFGSQESAVTTGRYPAFVEGMRELGLVPGKNLVIEARFANSDPGQLPAFVAELTRMKVEAIVATGGPVYTALRQSGTNIPVVITVTADPTIEGLAASLARPGGNFTGLSDTAAVLGPKHLELIMSAVPQSKRIGALSNPTNGSHPAQLQGLLPAAQKTGIRIVPASAATIAEIDQGLDSLARARADAVILFGDTLFTQQLQQIAQRAAKHRMPSIYLPREYARAGGLMSYGPDFVDNFRRAASFVDKILKGARPAELPFQQPTRYLFAINLKTAKALGISMPQTLLLRADEVIE